MRKVAYFLLFFLVTFPLAGAETYKFTSYKPKEGDKFQVEKKITQSQKVTIMGQVVREEREKITEVYEEEILEVKKGKVTKVSRSYEKSRTLKEKLRSGQVVSKALKKVKYEGKTVLITLGVEGTKAEFRYKDGSSLSPEERRDLEEEFKKKGQVEEDDLIFPGEEVAEGEKWNLDISKIARSFDMKASHIDQKKSEAVGILKKVFDKEKRKMGQIEVNVKLKVIDLPRFQRAKGYMKYKFEGEGCLDGSTRDSIKKISGRSEITGILIGRKGPVQVKIEVEDSGRTETHPK